MQAVAFDTLKLARKLENAGFPPKQAQDVSASLAESIAEWGAGGNLATQKDVSEVKKDIAELKAAMNDMKFDIIKWVVGFGFAQMAMILGALRLHI